MEDPTNLWNNQGPIQGKTLRIATIQNPPLSGATRKFDDVYVGTGVVFEVVRFLERALNFSDRVLPPTRDPLSTLTQGDADMVAALLPISTQSELSDGVEYSTVLAVEQWVILMKRPQESASGTGLFAPFDTNVWLATLGALVAMGPVMFALLLLRRHLCAQKSREFPFGSCVWFVYSAIMKQGSTLTPVSDTSRLLFATWWLFITILTSFYTANLTAFLTLSRFTLPLEDARDLGQQVIRWVGQAGGALEHAILKGDELSYLRGSLQAGYGRLLNLEEKDILDYVMKGDVFLGERSAVERLVFRHYLKASKAGLDHANRCTLVYTTKPFMVRPLAFAFPQNTSLLQIINPALRNLVEGGLMRHFLNLDLPTREICPLNLGNSERQLRNADLLATYLTMAAGFCAATFSFIAEICITRLHKTPHDKSPPPKLIKTRLSKIHPKFSDSLLFYPRDFVFPPTYQKKKNELTMDSHLFLVHRALNVRVTRPYPRIAFTE